jgi:acetyl-CoA acetyltransferase
MPPGRYPDLGPFDMFREVLRGAFAEWKIRPQLVDGLLTSPAGQSAGQTDVYVHDKLISELGIRPTFAETINLGGATFAAMVHRASLAIQDGRANAVLCIGAGKFMKPGVGGAEMMARMISECDFEVPYGTFIPALYALIATQFMAERGITREDIARVAVSARKWALLNPKARMHGKGPLEIADIINSRPIAEPFHFLDCSIPSDGGGAVLVTRADIAQQISSRPAYVRGYGEYHPRGTISSAGNLVESGATVSGPEAFRRAGMTPADIDIVQLYDAFSATPLILLENLGFCEPGTSGKFVQSGATDPGGRLPMNTNGGLLSFGHTGDASGMSVLIEGARQVMGQAGPPQVEKADRVLVHCYGGMMFDHATLILAREP